MVADPRVNHDPRRRATRWFWGLVVLAVLLVGGLSRELMSPASPSTGVAVGVLGTFAVLTVVQAGRLMSALTGARRERKVRGSAPP